MFHLPAAFSLDLQFSIGPVTALNIGEFQSFTCASGVTSSKIHFQWLIGNESQGFATEEHYEVPSGYRSSSKLRLFVTKDLEKKSIKCIAFEDGKEVFSQSVQLQISLEDYPEVVVLIVLILMLALTFHIVYLIATDFINTMLVMMKEKTDEEPYLLKEILVEF